MDEIVQGLFIGIGAGVTTSIILGIGHLFVRLRDRHEQISYIRDLIVTKAELMFSATDIEVPHVKEKPIPGDLVRFTYFRDLRSSLLVALSSRATTLSYKEVSSLQKVLADIDRLMSDLTLNKGKTMPMTIAKKFYDNLQSLNWLGLPDKSIEE